MNVCVVCVCVCVCVCVYVCACVCTLHNDEYQMQAFPLLVQASSELAKSPCSPPTHTNTSTHTHTHSRIPAH